MRTHQQVPRGFLHEGNRRELTPPRLPLTPLLTGRQKAGALAAVALALALWTAAAYGFAYYLRPAFEAAR